MRKTLPVAIAALAIGLTGCATTKDKANTDKYPDEARNNYVNACTAEASKKAPGNDQRARAACKCKIAKLEATLPYNRKDKAINSFKEVDQAIKKGTITSPPPAIKPKYDQAEAACSR